MLFYEQINQLLKSWSLLMNVSLLIILNFYLSSCGKNMNSAQGHKFADGIINQLLIERSCQKSPLRYEKESLEVFSYYNELLMNEPSLLSYVSVRQFDFLNPLIMKPELFLQKLEEIKNNNKRLSSTERQRLVIDELFYLEQSVRRFEFSKCKFSTMTNKKVEDPRPYLKLGLDCLAKGCSLEELSLLNNEELSALTTKAVSLCEAITKNIISCRSELHIKRELGKVDEYIHYYLLKYKNEKFNKFYLLADNSRRFTCQKIANKIKMDVDIFASNLESHIFNIIKDSLTDYWISDNFELNIVRVQEDHRDAVKVVVTDKLISHVMSRFPNVIFLASSQTNMTNARVVAHEFGHVLGFPDCYSEIYDQKNNELIYFEHKKNELNLMCTINNFASIPSSYIQQLVEKSCVFK